MRAIAFGSLGLALIVLAVLSVTMGAQGAPVPVGAQGAPGAVGAQGAPGGVNLAVQVSEA